MLGVKICGLSTPDAVRAALTGGASHLGFMFFEKSTRNIAPDAAGRLAAPIRGRGASIVAVAVDPDNVLIDRLVADLQPDLIQLHGKETPTRVRQIAQRTGCGLIKVISVADASDIATAKAYDGIVEHLMFDTKPPKTSETPGGTGSRFDWTLMSNQRFQRPWFLAGGLDPWNVGEAIKLSGAPMLDVSSGVERGPGLKDPALITAFLDAVRRA
jgi:phosphoribosylanthranilate isomerase